MYNRHRFYFLQNWFSLFVLIKWRCCAWCILCHLCNEIILSPRSVLLLLQLSQHSEHLAGWKRKRLMLVFHSVQLYSTSLCCNYFNYITCYVHIDSFGCCGLVWWLNLIKAENIDRGFNLLYSCYCCGCWFQCIHGIYN